jgi:hypothetical protein
VATVLDGWHVVVAEDAGVDADAVEEVEACRTPEDLQRKKQRGGDETIEFCLAR